MRTSRRLIVAALAAILLIPLGARAEDWPCFMGPRGDGTSSETGLARSWPAQGPPVLWTVALGAGFGGAAARDGAVYLLDRVDHDKDVLRALDLETGREHWRRAYDARGRLDYAGSRSVPTVTEGRIYTVGAFGHVQCIDRTTHEPVWSFLMTDRYPKADLPKWGWAQSPLLHEGKVFIAPLAGDAGLVALDAETGAEVWRSGDLGTTHSNPVVVDLAGAPHLLLLTTIGRKGVLTAFDPATGAVRWTSTAYENKLSIPPPLRIDEGRIFLTGGYDAGSLMLQVTREDDSFVTSELFRSPRGSQIHMPMLHEEHLYLLANENSNHSRRRRDQGGLMCLDLAGAEKWRTGETPFMGRGGVLLADGLLLIQDGEDGTLRLVKPAPERFTLLAEAAIFGAGGGSDQKMWAPMALSRGRLLLRSQSELKCVDVTENGIKGRSGAASGG